MKKLKILLVNEEGCFHPGIISLARVLSGAGHRVNIVAPLNPLSGSGHSITNEHAPLRVKQFFVLDKIKIFGVTGTPTDCVLLGLHQLLKSKPDLIISGIDPINNRGETIFSSGVVSAAVAGTIQGVKSIALSANCENAKGEKEFLVAARTFKKYLADFVELIEDGITLNINFPSSPTKRKVQFTHATDAVIDNKYSQEVNSFGAQFYWLETPRMGFGLEAYQQKGDLYWLKKNFITVTPIKLNLTCRPSIEILEKAKIKL